MEQLTEIVAKKMLKDRNIELGFDTRSALQVARTILQTGSPSIINDVGEEGLQIDQKSSGEVY